MTRQSCARAFASGLYSGDWGVRKDTVERWIARGEWTPSETAAVLAMLRRRREDGEREFAITIAASALFVAVVATAVPVIQLLIPAASANTEWLKLLIVIMFITVMAAVVGVLTVGSGRTRRSREATTLIDQVECRLLLEAETKKPALGRLTSMCRSRPGAHA